MGALVFFAIVGFALSTMSLFLVISWAKDLDERVKKLEQKNEKTN